MSTTNNKISTCLWLDNQAEDVAQFYASVFENAKTTNIIRSAADTPSGAAGTVLTVNLDIEGQQFLLLNGGPKFKINPSISFFYTCDNKEIADSLWQKLSEGGKTIMPLAKYPFSEYYGWVQDKFGFSWQLILNNPTGEDRPKMMPSLLFTKDQLGKAEEAIHFYTSIFDDAEISKNINYYPPEMPNREGMLAFGDFTLLNQWFAAMDSGVDSDFAFNEAVSFVLPCNGQDEIDYYWDKLSADPQAGQCGWQKDKYGVSWQIVPKNMGELIHSKTSMQAMLKMKKIDIEALKNA